MNDPVPLPEETRYLKRRDTSTEHGWQFQFELDPIKESKWFSDKKYGSREAALDAAKQYRKDFFQTAQELGMVADDGSLAGGDLPIYISLNARNTSGIVGVCRITTRRRNARRPEDVWAANYRTDAGKHTQKKFSVNAMGERAALLSALKFRRDYVASVVSTVWLEHKRQLVEKHLEDMRFLVEYIESVVDESELYTFLSTLNSPDISPTEKQALIDTRIGQAKFRKLVLAFWRDACCVTGATLFLTAAHIKPWAIATDQERLDPYNGLALSPNLDKAFDTGFISFQNDGSLIASAALGQDMTRLGFNHQARIFGLDSRHLPYLSYHRATIFRPR